MFVVTCIMNVLNLVLIHKLSYKTLYFVMVQWLTSFFYFMYLNRFAQFLHTFTLWGRCHKTYTYTMSIWEENCLFCCMASKYISRLPGFKISFSFIDWLYCGASVFCFRSCPFPSFDSSDMTISKQRHLCFGLITQLLSFGVFQLYAIALKVTCVSKISFR